MQKILMKHMCSAADDAYVEYEMDGETKVVTVRMSKGSNLMSFFSDAHLVSLAWRIHSDTGISFETIDSDKVESFPTCSDYTVVVAIDEVWYQAKIVRQISLTDDRVGPAVVELIPLRLADENLNYRLRSADRLVHCKQSAADAIKALTEKGVVAQLFGSTLTGKVRPRSDIDLLITECAGISEGEILHLAEMASTVNVDVVFAKYCKPEFLERIHEQIRQFGVATQGSADGENHE